MLDDILWALQPEAAQNIFCSLAGQLAAVASVSPVQKSSTPAAVSPFGDTDDAHDASYYWLQDDVAVISVTGTITRTSFFGWTQGQDDIAFALEHALANPNVKAILLNVNSPGGVVSGTKELADKIRAAAAIKPMASYADGLMASAAIWLGAATGRIYAPVTATLGSIGVISRHVDWSKYNERMGVAFTYITAGRLKSAGNMDNPLSKEAAAMFQKQADEIHAIFKADVAAALNLSAPESQWAEGQTMLAAEAQSLGLVRQTVQDLESAINLLSKEITMDLATLAAKHPDLLAQIQNQAKAEAAAEAQAAAQAETQAALAKQNETVLALVGQVAGADAQTKLSGIMASGITPEQLASLAALLGPQPAPAQAPTQDPNHPPSAQDQTAAGTAPDPKAAILAALQNVTPGALAGGIPPVPAAPKAKSALLADAERRNAATPKRP